MMCVFQWERVIVISSRVHGTETTPSARTFRSSRTHSQKSGQLTKEAMEMAIQYWTFFKCFFSVFAVLYILTIKVN